MTWEWQAEFMRYWLALWADPRGGYVKVLANPKHLWEQIYIVDEQPRIMICCTGEIARGGFNQANTMHRVDRQWMVAILRGHGFKNLIAEGHGQPNTKTAIDPFLKQCQEVRDRLRVMINITEEPPIDYKSMDSLPSIAPYGPTGNIFMDGYGIKFSTACDIPAITDIDPNA